MPLTVGWIVDSPIFDPLNDVDGMLRIAAKAQSCVLILKTFIASDS
jgi:hypothetical protein